jgi:hypothetical protein
MDRQTNKHRKERLKNWALKAKERICGGGRRNWNCHNITVNSDDSKNNKN